MDGERCLSTAHAHDVDTWWLRPVIPDVDEAREVRSDRDAVHPGLRRQALGLPAVQRSPEQVTLERAILPADEVELATLLIERHRRFGSPVAARQLPDQF